MTEMIQPTVLNASGNPMSKHWVFTYCNAADALAARQKALEFMQQPGRAPCDTTADTMLNLDLRPVGSSGAPTHHGCIREAYCDEFGQQKQFMRDECSGITSFAWLEADLESALTQIGLEVC